MAKNNIELNEQFVEALEAMENTSKHIFITGKAGTGKSTLLDYFRSVTRKKIVVLAPTGVAALNVRGQTIHSFFGFKP
ncbi:MAG: AAA family ATPase, partial [Candidatus Omnitrophota bacterium]